MTDKKIKRINVRISLENYEQLKDHYDWAKRSMKSKHKTFSEYIRYLLDIGLYDYY